VKQNNLVNGLFASPNSSQLCLAKLHRKGLLQKVITQNHDGLLQKAGFPQEDTIEIHGGWYDPSNPPVKYTENLKSDLIELLKFESNQTDLLLVLGTSLSGMNADQIAEKIAGRNMRNQSLGIVIINLQQTRLDKSASLRIWSKLGDVFSELTKLLKLEDIENPLWVPRLNYNDDIFEIPYDTEGKLSDISSKLDLSIGATLKIVDPSAPNYGASLTVIEKDKSGDWVLLESGEEGGINKRRRLHRWWIDVAHRGRIRQFPIVNPQ